MQIEMSFNPYPSNYSVFHPQFQQDMNYANNGSYPNMLYQNQGFPYYYPIYQGPQPNHVYQGQNFNRSTIITVAPNTNELVNSNLKRQSKPLTVCDAISKDPINLHSLSEEMKSNSNNKNVSKLENTADENCKVTTLDEYKSIKNVENKLSDDSESLKKENVDENKNCTVLKMTIEPNNDNENNENVIESIISRQDKLEKLASDNNLLEKPEITNPMAPKNKEGDPSRLIYNKQDLLDIKNNSNCPRPKFDCQEIEYYDITNKINADNELICTPNGYKPPNKRWTDDDLETSKLEMNRRQFKCILNKIAPQNFDLCFQEMIQLILDVSVEEKVEDYMNCLIKEIFLKAVQEETYSVTYADLCTAIIAYECRENLKWSFKAQLVDRCKTMFQTPLQLQLADIRRYWEKKIEEESDDKMKELYISDIDEQVKKEKDKFFGNIRFIGELYLHDLIKASIIETCIKELMSKRNDENAMLSLCKLLEICGKKFDAIHNDKIKEFINTMREIANSEDVENRIKFRLFDIIEMSQRNWKLNAVQAQKMIQPKTLDQVKQDDINEKKFEASKFAYKGQHRVTKIYNNNHGEMKYNNCLSTKQSFEINSLQMKSDNNIELKPSYNKWDCVSGVKENEWRSKNYHKNFNVTNQNSKSTPFVSQDTLPINRSEFIIPQENDPDHIIETEHEEIQSITNSNSTSLSREQSPNNMSLSDDVILDGDGIFVRFLDTGLLDDHSWSQLTDISKTLAKWIDKIMEKNKLTRNMMGDELAKLIDRDKLAMNDLIEAIKIFLEDVDDLKTDIPLVWTFLAQCLERLIVNVNSDLTFCNNIIESQKSATDAVNCISLCLKFADDRLGHDVMYTLIENCVTWSLKDFDDIDQEYLESRGLGFLIDFIIDATYFDHCKNDLSMLLSNDVNMINHFLEDRFTDNLIQSKHCVYFVSSCICAHLCGMSEKDIIDYLHRETLFLHDFNKKRLEFEFQIILALNDCVLLSDNRDVLTTIIRCLMDNIISIDTLHRFIDRAQISASATDDLLNSNRPIVDVIRSLLAT